MLYFLLCFVIWWRVGSRGARCMQMLPKTTQEDGVGVADKLTMLAVRCSFTAC